MSSHMSLDMTFFMDMKYLMMNCIKRVILLSSLVASGFAFADLPEDNLEGFNRAVYSFNKGADRLVLKPLAKGYQWVTPDFVERRVGSFFSNLSDLKNIANSALQLKPQQTATSVARLTLNSTFGLAGLFDVASPMGIRQHPEDFGQTLGYWGVPAGSYLVLPLFGPSTLRDTLGMVPDQYTQATTYMDHVPTRNTLTGLGLINTRVNLFASEQLISGDEYSFVRDAYLQQREFLILDGKMDSEFNEDDF